MTAIQKNSIHLMLLLAPRTRERLTLENVNNLNLASITDEVKKKTDLNEFTFIHHGRVLNDGTSLSEQGIKGGSIVQVLPASKRRTENNTSETVVKILTEADVQEIVIKFRTVSMSNFHKASKPEFIQKILSKYENLRNNLSAVAFLKDPVLLASIGNLATVRRLAETHRDLLDASQFIVDTLNNTAITPATAEPTEELTDSSDSENNIPSTSRSRVPRRITSNQLASALGQVYAVSATGSSNSLANISQRNLNQAATVADENSPTPRITNSMFMNALSEVIRSNRNINPVRPSGDPVDETPTANPTVTTPTAPAPVSSVMPPMYAAELREMREMGLTDTNINLQALILSNGDLETAINIVLSGANN